MNTTDANREAQSTSSPHRGEHLDLFGPPPLFEGEDAKAYDEFLTRISTAVKPVDILDAVAAETCDQGFRCGANQTGRSSSPERR
jgi:hypothetical protein